MGDVQNDKKSNVTQLDHA